MVVGFLHLSMPVPITTSIPADGEGLWCLHNFQQYFSCIMAFGKVGEKN